MTVVITGLGTVDAFAGGRAATAAALAGATTHLTEIDRSAGYHRSDRSRHAVLVQGLQLQPWLSPVAARRLSPPSRYAVVAARRALNDAGLEPDEPATAVVVATSYGAASVTERIFRQAMLDGPEAVSPALFTESVSNAPAAQVALACQARGANLTVVQREAGPLIALARGAAEVARGRARRAIVGAVEELNPLIHSILDRLKVLATHQDDGDEMARPFDRRRQGVLAGDGAAMLVLEEETAARERGAPILARIAMTASAFDPMSPRVGWSSDPACLASSLAGHLDRHHQEPAAIDRIVSWASGTVPGDRLEALVLRRLWDRQSLPPLLAPKSVLGEHGGALLAAAVLAAAGAPFGPTRGFDEPDPELAVSPHDGSPLPAPQRLLVTALAAGGAAAWAVLERAER